MPKKDKITGCMIQDFQELERKNDKNGENVEKNATISKTCYSDFGENEQNGGGFDKKLSKSATRAKTLSKTDDCSMGDLHEKCEGIADNVFFLNKTSHSGGKNIVLENQLCMDFGDFDKNIEKNSSNCDTVQSDYDVFDDNMVLSNESGDDPSLNLVKKKVATHFVAPDMIAIKILFEIFDRKVEDNDLDKISDEELMELKTKLLEEIKNEDY